MVKEFQGHGIGKSMHEDPGILITEKQERALN